MNITEIENSCTIELYVRYIFCKYSNIISVVLLIGMNQGENMFCFRTKNKVDW